MENHNDVIFEKNAVLKFVKEIKNYGNVFIITSPTPKKQYSQMLSNLLNENKITFWFHCLSSTKCCSDNILKTCSKVKGANVIVALGAGTVCDVAKIVGEKLNLPVIVLPTTITHFGIFNNVAILNDGIPKYVETKYPSKVFLDEAIIHKSPNSFINSSLCFSISLLEKSFSLKTKEILLGENIVPTFELDGKIKKIEELTGWLSLSKEFAILNLMDYIFDISQILKNDYKSNAIILASKLNCSTLKHNFGEKCLLCSRVLFVSYLKYFNQKIVIPKDIPNYEKIKNIISKIPINQNFSTFSNVEEKFNEFINQTNCLLNQNLRLKIQANRMKIFENALNFCNITSKFTNKLKAINSDENKIRMIDEQELFSSLQILPLLENQFLPSLLSRYGYLNVG